MIDAPVALAFSAGLVATVNPCGFAMLPAYLAWFVGVEGSAASLSPAARLRRALAVSGLVATAFVGVFGAVGLLVTAGALLVIDVVPWLAMLVGLGLAATGIAMLRGWKPVVALPQPAGRARGRGSGSVALFGVSYAVASLSCTLPVFLAVVGSTVTRRDLTSGVTTFLGYAAGMSLVLVAVTVAVAFTRGGFVQRLRRASRHVDRAAGLLLVVSGAYVAFYWAYTLAVLPGSSPTGFWARVAEVPVGLVESASAWSVNRLQRWALPVGVVLAGVVVAAAWIALGRRSPGRDERACRGLALATVGPPSPRRAGARARGHR
ncbi:MAG: cytochrome c biogenesis protein CcdA [Acidimicrobiia bacterium]|nr:cytochrome c biogenesis protein CcdA [Acidimicrobiia bacterium]